MATSPTAARPRRYARRRRRLRHRRDRWAHRFARRRRHRLDRGRAGLPGLPRRRLGRQLNASSSRIDTTNQLHDVSRSDVTRGRIRLARGDTEARSTDAAGHRRYATSTQQRRAHFYARPRPGSALSRRRRAATAGALQACERFLDTLARDSDGMTARAIDLCEIAPSSPPPSRHHEIRTRRATPPRSKPLARRPPRDRRRALRRRRHPLRADRQPTTRRRRAPTRRPPSRRRGTHRRRSSACGGGARLRRADGRFTLRAPRRGVRQSQRLANARSCVVEESRRTSGGQCCCERRPRSPQRGVSTGARAVGSAPSIALHRPKFASLALLDLPPYRLNLALAYPRSQ